MRGGNLPLPRSPTRISRGPRPEVMSNDHTHLRLETSVTIQKNMNLVVCRYLIESVGLSNPAEAGSSRRVGPKCLYVGRDS